MLAPGTGNDIVQFIVQNGTGSVQVEGPPAVNVGVRDTSTGRKYIQTFADQTWTNNSGTGDRRFDTGANWSPSGVPGAGGRLRAASTSPRSRSCCACAR